MRGSATRESDKTTRSTAAEVTEARGWLLCAIRAPDGAVPLGAGPTEVRGHVPGPTRPAAGLPAPTATDTQKPTFAP